jgi:hypothetical protein
MQAIRWNIRRNKTLLVSTKIKYINPVYNPDTMLLNSPDKYCA